MRILVAPDKFKGTLSAKEACQAIKRGLERQGKKLEITLHPMADGGDGSLEVLAEYLNLKIQIVQTIDPLGREITAQYYTSSEAAFIELASASGLVLLKEEERNPLKTSTFGTGKMIADSVAKGYENLFLFLGGSATNDAGIGIAMALGWQFFDGEGKVIEPIGENLSRIKTLKFNRNNNFENLQITFLCDVTNPLFGPNGAAHVYASQKGATVEQIKYLDNGLRSFSQIIHQQLQIEVTDLPGIGAAGGVGAGLVALFGAKMKNGFEMISTLTNLEKKIQEADLVISGEGKLDSQSLQGKVIGGVAKLCKKHHKPLVLFLGKSELQDRETNILEAKHIFSILEKAKNINDAMSGSAKYLEDMAFNLLITDSTNKRNLLFQSNSH